MRGGDVGAIEAEGIARVQMTDAEIGDSLEDLELPEKIT